MLEVWNEIKVELEQENIRPVSPDADCMVDISRILNDRAAGVSSTQVTQIKRSRGRDGNLGSRDGAGLFGRGHGRQDGQREFSGEKVGGVGS